MVLIIGSNMTAARYVENMLQLTLLPNLDSLQYAHFLNSTS